MSEYFDALTDTMKWLSDQDRTVFIGQGVGCAGTTMTDTLSKVSRGKLIEFPVAEDMQMGVSIGMSLEGHIPISVFPRWNFMLCAANQIVNHLDRIPIYSGYRPKVLIRVATPITSPFYPGPQHDDDFTLAFNLMLRTVRIVTLTSAEQILPAYREAFDSEHSTILVEYTKLYNAVPSAVKS